MIPSPSLGERERRSARSWVRFMVPMRISRVLRLSMNRGEPVAYIWRNPFRVVKTRRFQPRVASQARQPWALRRNPFGIRGLRFRLPVHAPKRNEALHEPSNEHVAPTELEEEPRGVGSYRHGAPTELCKSVQGPIISELFEAKTMPN